MREDGKGIFEKKWNSAGNWEINKKHIKGNQFVICQTDFILRVTCIENFLTKLLNTCDQWNIFISESRVKEVRSNSPVASSSTAKSTLGNWCQTFIQFFLPDYSRPKFRGHLFWVITLRKNYEYWFIEFIVPKRVVRSGFDLVTSRAF